MSAKRIRISTTLSKGKVRKMASLTGYAYLESGFLTGLIQADRQEAMSKSEQALMAAFTFTGCPLAAHVQAASMSRQEEVIVGGRFVAHSECHDINPWVETGGAYMGRRILKGDYFSVRSHLLSRPTSDSIDMQLDLEVEGEIPNIVGVARPFQERISQKRSGFLQGIFDIVFLTDNGEVRCGAETEYELDISHSVSTVFRNITILLGYEKHTLRQVEQIDLFDDKEMADIDLAARVAVQ